MATRVGMAALPFVSGEMLDRGAACLAGKLGQACLMHAMPAAGIDADRTDMVQTLDQAEHRGGFVASGIWRSQASQLWPLSARRCVSASSRRR